MGVARPTRRAVLAGLAGAAASLATGQAETPAMAFPISRGVNTFPWFSLTREYPAPRTDYAWPPFQDGRPMPTAGDLGRLRQAGFDFIRIPVDPGPFLAAAPADRQRLMVMLTGAASMALDAGLRVIVNVQANAATHFWTPQRLTGDIHAPTFDAYRRLAADMAAALERLDPARIALEPVNEPIQACAAQAWPEMQRALFAAIREAAPALTLVATGACGSMIAGLEAFDPRPFEAFAPLLYTVHFYEPYLFTHQGAPWMRSEPVYRSLNAVPWPASAGSLEATLAAVRRRMAEGDPRPEAEKRAAYRETERVLAVYFDAAPDRRFIEGYFGKVDAWSARFGIEKQRILLGEFGALRSDARYVAAGRADRARYVRDVRLTAEAHGLPWAFWNLFDGMGLMEDDTHAFDPQIMDALGLAVPKG